MNIESYQDELRQLALAFPERVGNLEIRFSPNGEMAVFVWEHHIVGAVWVEKEGEVMISYSPDPQDCVKKVACDMFVTSKHQLNVAFREWEQLPAAA
jgi:hypothetical protein